jgi:SAM-dependent methyltransferase
MDEALTRRVPRRVDRHCGRLKVIESLIDLNKFSLNSGSKEVYFRGNKCINIDINPQCRPDVVADARYLPFKKEIFDQVLFTDVLEHLPKNDEPKALREIYKCLCKKGELILTTPNDRLFFTSLDPARYMMGHRHYKVSCVRSLVSSCGFSPGKIFTGGLVWAFINVLWYCFVTYPVKRMFHYSPLDAPLALRSLENREYEKISKNGYTIFLKAARV